MRAKKLDGDKLAFDFVDVPQADAKKRGFMRSLALTFKDADPFVGRGCRGWCCGHRCA